MSRVRSHTVSRTLPALAALAAALLLAGCANLAPSYQRTDAPVPATFAQAGATPAGTADATLTASATTALPDWQALVREPRLRQTIALALDHSRSLRLAVLAIEQARTSAGIADAARLPTVTANGAQAASGTPALASSSGQAVRTRSYSANLGVSAFELDFFGKARNLSDAALETLLSTEAAQASTRLTLVADVASAWLTLAADQAQLALARATLDSQTRTHDTTLRRQQLGADSALAVAQARTALEAARRDVAACETQVQQDRNALRLLVGAEVPEALLPDAPLPAAAAPGTAATPGTPAAEATALVAVPADLPSEVLRRRPDVLAAEHALKAAHADIGAARAALYPSIRLTGAAGTASRHLGELFQGGAWSFAPSISLPVFDGGAARAGVRAAELARDAQLASYERTLQTAFREVADALALRAGLAARQQAQDALVDAARRSLDLASARWQGGAASFLDVLDAQRTLYAAQQAQITLRLAEQGNRLTLYKALGGAASDTEPAVSKSS